VESFAPNFLDAVIFRLVNRDFALALKVSGQFRRIPTPVPKLRPEAAAIIAACHQAGWKIALTSNPHEENIKALQKAGAWDKVSVKGPPPAMKIELPDPRVLEFLLGTLAVTPRDCLMLGTRLDNNVRPAKTLRMGAIHLKLGRHGTKQLPRDMRDVPDYEAADIKALLALLPTIQ
jgi:FMN phosphatase YigB (HAD superfamily)